MRQRAVWPWLVPVCGCVAAPAVSTGTAAPVVASPPAAAVAERCRPVPGEALARVRGPGCGFALKGGLEGLTLVGLGLADTTEIRGPWPEACPTVAACRFFAVLEPGLGPLFVVERIAAESEIPAAVVLVVRDGSTLRSLDLWEGAEHVHGDEADLGPAHALRPHVCPEGLALVVEARQPGAERTTIPPALVERAGLYGPGGIGPRPLASRVGCRPSVAPWP